jgi:hypothetical protein
MKPEKVDGCLSVNSLFFAYQWVRTRRSSTRW